MKMLLCLCSCHRPGGPSDIIQIWPPKCSHHALLRDTRSWTRRLGMGPWVWIDCPGNRCKSQIQQRHERVMLLKMKADRCAAGATTEGKRSLRTALQLTCSPVETASKAVVNNLLQKQQSRSVEPHSLMSKALGGTRNICILI